MNKLISILIAGGIILLIAVSAVADVVPSRFWTNFYGSASTYNGQPIPVGSVIDAYDPDGIHCGQAYVDESGQYGFMLVYGEDTYIEGDQGAESGNSITFYVNGQLAIPEGPDDPNWIGDGARVEVNLSASATVGMEPVTDIEYIIAEPGDTVHVSAMVRNIGEGIDFYSVFGSSVHSWIVKPMFGFVYALPDQAVIVEFEIYVPVALFDEIDETVDYRISSGVDPSVYVDNQVVIQVRMPTDVGDDEKSVLPGDFELQQNYPNPFNPTTTIRFSLPREANVSLDVFDILGRQVEHYQFDRLDAGSHSVEFDGKGLSSGIYFYRLLTDDFSDMRKMVLLK